MGRWTLKLLAELSGGGRRYHDLHGALGGISHMVLTDTLRRAEREGLVTRHVDAGRVETATLYRLTDVGRSLDGPLAALDRWTPRTGMRSKQPASTGTSAVNSPKRMPSCALHLASVGTLT